MFGIVISFNKSTGQGIVWCEDQQDLAILDAKHVLRENTRELEPGDQFFFQEKRCKGVRKVKCIDQFFSKSPDMITHDPAQLIQQVQRQAYRPSLREVG